MAAIERQSQAATGPLRHLNKGNPFSQRMKDGRSLNRLLRKSMPEIAAELVRLALHAESESVRTANVQYITDRCFGRPAAAPEDAMAAAAAVIQVLSGIARRPTDPVLIDAAPQQPVSETVSGAVPTAQGWQKTAE